MHVAKIEIQNVKGFGDGDDGVSLDLTEGGARRLAGWTVFAGVNGSGKTTLLQAVALGLVTPTVYLAVADKLPDWVRHGAPSGEGRFVFRAGEDDEHLQGKSSGARALDHEVTWPRSGMVEWSSSADRLLDEQSNDSFVAAYGPNRRVNGSSDEQRNALLAHPRRMGVMGMLRGDSNLGESESWLKDLDYRRRASDAEAEKLLGDILMLLNDDLLPGELTVLGVEPSGLRVRHRGVELSMQSLSHGYRTTAAFAVDLVMRMSAVFRDRFRVETRDGHPLVPHSGVVLVDEMELHLHPSWQQKIGFWLKAHFPNIQFLITTHSPFICQAADALVRLSLPGDGRKVTEIVDEETYRRVTAGGADDAVVSSLFGLDFPYAPQIEEARERLAVLEGKELHGRLSEAERPELEDLARRLPSTPSVAVERALRKLGTAR